MRKERLYDRDGNEIRTGRRFSAWVAAGLLIGLLLGIGFYVGRAYEVYRFSEIADQVAQKYSDIMAIIQKPIQISRPSQGSSPVNDTMTVISMANVPNAEVSAQNTEPSVTKLLAKIEESNRRDEEALKAEMKTTDEEPVDPTADYAVVDIDVRLRDLNTDDLTWLDDGGIAELGTDQYVTVWVNLPDGIDKLDARFESSYPAAIKAGETGTIEVSVVCYDNQTKYIGSLTISATDDLTLGTARRYTRHVTYSGFEVEHGYFWDVEDETRLHTHAAYALYTSCDSNTEMYDKHNGIYGSGISVRYNLSEK